MVSKEQEEKKKDAYQWGKIAEKIVAEWMLAKGYTIRERNWRPSTSKSEIDIIAQKDDTLVFTEVKARSDKDLDPAEAITPDKIKKVVRGANSYLNMQDFDFFFRFDVATVSGTPDDYVLDYLEDAFLPPLKSR